MRPQKITFGDMREMDVRGVLVYCADYHCSHSVAMNADCWADDDAGRTSNPGPLVCCRLSAFYLRPQHFELFG